MIRLLAPAALLLAACQPMPESAPTTAERCDIVVSFGSVCCGIDQDARTRISVYLDGDRRVAGVSERRWGKEGEIDLCVAARSDTDGLLSDLAAMVPPREGGSSTGTVNVRKGE